LERTWSQLDARLDARQRPGADADAVERRRPEGPRRPS
jgi:hypothetical protein